jgi:hypothetical protein
MTAMQCAEIHSIAKTINAYKEPGEVENSTPWQNVRIRYVKSLTGIAIPTKKYA